MRCGLALLLLVGVIAAQTPKREPTGTLRGVVKDTSGDPVSGVSVSTVRSAVGAGVAVNGVYISRPPWSSVTDEAGVYALDLPAGTYLLLLSRDRAVLATRQIKLDAGQDLTLDLVVPASPAIIGRVLHSNREPAVDAFVWLLSAEYQRGGLKQVVIGPQVTNADGSYAFDTGIETNRRYLVLVDRPPPEGIVPAAAAALKNREPIEIPTYFPSVSRMESATPVILQPGERRERVDIKIATAPFYCVDGKIQVSGKPSSSDFAIQTTPLVGSKLARVRGSASDDGAFHACGLAPESYRLSTDDGFTDFTVFDADVHRLDLSTYPAHLRLQVDWEEPPAPPDISKLDPSVTASLRQFAALMGSDAPSNDDLQKLIVRMSQPDPADTDLLRALMQTDRNDKFKELLPVIGLMRGRSEMVNVALINTTTGAEPSLMGNIPFEGPFRDIPPGEYVVSVRSMVPNDSYVKEVSYYDVLTDRILHVAPAVTGTVRILMARGAASLAVRVTGSDGQPVPDATVLLVPASVTSVPSLARDLIHGQSDQNGSCTFQPLPPGKYRVLATTQWIRWGAPEDLEKLLPVLFQAKEVELSPKDNLQIPVEPVPI